MILIDKNETKWNNKINFLCSGEFQIKKISSTFPKFPSKTSKDSFQVQRSTGSPGASFCLLDSFLWTNEPCADLFRRDYDETRACSCFYFLLLQNTTTRAFARALKSRLRRGSFSYARWALTTYSQAERERERCLRFTNEKKSRSCEIKSEQYLARFIPLLFFLFILRGALISYWNRARRSRDVAILWRFRVSAFVGKSGKRTFKTH